MNPVKDWIVQQLLTLALPVLVGALAFYAVQALKALSDQIDQAGPKAKAALAFVVTAAMALLAKFAGDALPPACILDDGEKCLEALTDPTAMKTLLAFLFATALKAWQKNARGKYRRVGWT